MAGHCLNWRRNAKGLSYRMELPQGDERINPRQQKMRPAMLPAMPEGLRLPPLVEFNFLRMLQRAFKNFPRGNRRRRVFEPQHQFVIQIETANVEIGRADVGDAIA